MNQKVWMTGEARSPSFQSGAVPPETETGEDLNTNSSKDMWQQMS